MLTLWLHRRHASPVHLDGYNIFRTDCRAKGCGVVIYTKKTFQTIVLTSESVPKQYELLEFKV